MSDYLIGVIVSAIISLATVLFNNHQQSKKRAVDEAVKEERLNHRLASIESKLDTHNGYAEKLGDIQKDMSAISTDIAVMKNDIKTLYKKGE